MHVVALGLYGLEEFAESLVVFVDDKIRFGHDDGAVFKVDKAMRPLEMEIHLLRIEKMEHRDVVLAEAKVLESVGQLLPLEIEYGGGTIAGELALDGMVRPIRGATSFAAFARGQDQLPPVQVANCLA